MYKRTLSYSQVKLFEECPYKYKKLYIDKIKVPPSEALEKGIKKHEEMVNIINQHVLTEDENLNFFLNKYIYENNFQIFVEKQNEYLQIGYKDFSISLKIDVYLLNKQKRIARVIDWKTGFSDGDTDQLKLYSLYLSKKYPELEIFETIFYYLDKNYFEKMIYNISDIKEFENDFLKKCQNLISYEEFEMKPNKYCSYCPFILTDCKNEISKYQLPDKIENESQLYELIELVQLFDGITKKSKELIKEYMLEKKLTKIINKKSLSKCEISFTPTMRISNCTKDDLVNMLSYFYPDKSKKELLKLKNQELKDLLKSI